VEAQSEQIREELKETRVSYLSQVDWSSVYIKPTVSKLTALRVARMTMGKISEAVIKQNFIWEYHLQQRISSKW